DPEISLPCLPTTAFEESARGSWSCEMPLPIVIGRFFVFFARLFKWGQEVVSVRLGRRLDAADANHFRALNYRLVQRIHLEDPLETARNLHCVLGKANESRLRAAFDAAVSSLRAGEAPVGLWLLQGSRLPSSMLNDAAT
ncbi:unnamed protein product, partial [Polarella glacialis]